MRPKKLVYGVGNNNTDYAVVKWEEIGYIDGKRKRKMVWKCPYYVRWEGMLNRCYSTKLHECRPTYKGCIVLKEWLTFSVFKNWMMTQDWEDKHLDKDLLFEGNKVYGPDTCVFVSPMVNTFTTDSGAARGEWLIGVDWYKRAGKFRARCRNPFSEKERIPWTIHLRTTSP